MKKIFLFIITLFSISELNAQMFRLNDQTLEQLSFEKVIPVDSVKSEVLYLMIKKWMAESYGDADEVTKYDEKNKNIYGKGHIPFNVNNITYNAASGYISYNIDIRIKDNRFKVKVYGFVHTSTHPTYGYGWSNGLVYKECPSDEIMKKNKWGALKRRQYKKVDERVRPVCIGEWADIVLGLESSIINNLNDRIEEENW